MPPDFFFATIDESLFFLAFTDSKGGPTTPHIYELMIRGRFFLTKSETKCPLTPCPSHTPNIHRPSIPARFFTEIKLS
jgi:hypothetical protein